CAWNSFHPLQAAQVRAARGVGDFLELHTYSRANLIAANVDLVEVAAGRVSHHATDSAIAHQKIGAATDHQEGNIFAAAVTDQLSEGLFVARFDPELRGSANAESSMF